MSEEPSTLFDAVARAVKHDPPNDAARGFGSSGLKVGGKIFAMLVGERLVVKLPRHRVQELVAAGDGVPFDPGHGRVMREWVSIPATDSAHWIHLADEAREFVAPVR